MTNPSEPTAPLSTVKHLNVSTQKSGQTTAGADWAALGDSRIYSPTGVWVKNDHASDSLSVRNAGDTLGITVPAGESRFFPVELLSHLEVKRGGTNAVTVSWFLA